MQLVGQAHLHRIFREAYGMTPLEYMRRHGAFEVPYAGQERYEQDGKIEMEQGGAKKGFSTPSGKLEFFSSTLRDWGFADDAIPAYIRSQELPVVEGARPWNPPYQPGPGIDDRPAYEWAAGAGIEAVLDSDADMEPYLFPNGTSAQAVRQ